MDAPEAGCARRRVRGARQGPLPARCPPLRTRPGPPLAATVLALAALVVAACGSGGAPLTLTLRHVRPIDPANGHYELWAATAGGWQSAGKFRIGADGGAVDLAGKVRRWTLPAPAGAVTALAVSQELPGDADDRPSKQIFLRGAFADGRAALRPGVAPADVASATGTFLLDNPVTVEDLTDRNGLWFARWLNRRYKPGLMLYDAPQGWLWAGWVLLRGHALRTGKFLNGGANDDWAGYSGRSGASPLIDPAGRPMPGEDFISNLPAGLPTGRNLPDLAGARVLVTLEDATLANEELWPSPVVIFEGYVPAHTERLAAYPLENAAARLPAADAQLE